MQVSSVTIEDQITKDQLSTLINEKKSRLDMMTSNEHWTGDRTLFGGISEIVD